MPSRGKKTVSFLRVSSLLEQDCSCDRRFGERVGSYEANSKRRSRPTAEILGRQGEGKEQRTDCLLLARSLCVVGFAPIPTRHKAPVSASKLSLVR